MPAATPMPLLMPLMLIFAGHAAVTLIFAAIFAFVTAFIATDFR